MRVICIEEKKSRCLALVDNELKAVEYNKDELLTGIVANTFGFYIDASQTDGFLWGIDGWGGGRDKRLYKITLGDAQGRSVKFRFRIASEAANINHIWKIHNMKVTYNLRKERFYNIE
jgi:hypothetical protein